MDIIYPEGEELVEGSCRNCDFTQLRPPEELEPGSECPKCGVEAFGGPVDDPDFSPVAVPPVEDEPDA